MLDETLDENHGVPLARRPCHDIPANSHENAPVLTTFPKEGCWAKKTPNFIALKR